MEKHITAFNPYLDDRSVKQWERMCREHGTLRIFKKGEEFISVGEVARYVGLIKSGAVKYVVYTPDGQERVIGLETAGGYVASFPYCLRGLPAVCSVVLHSDAEIYCLPVQTVEALMQGSSEIRQQIARSLEAVFYTLYGRYVDLYALSPKERYEQLLTKCPRLFEIFQLKDIASYLNITRQHLRRLRAERTEIVRGGVNHVDSQLFTGI